MSNVHFAKHVNDEMSKIFVFKLRIRIPKVLNFHGENI